MLSSLMLVAALVPFVSPFAKEDKSQRLISTGKKVQELPASSLYYVYAFFRHGIRSPLYETYPKDPYKPRYHEIFTGPLGKLTTTGKQQMYEVGENLSSLYGNFVDGYSEEKVRVSSTETSRTIMTALSVMAGLFPPKQPIFKDLNWQPIPVWQDTRSFDKVYFYNDPDFPNLALKECPSYGKMIKEGYQTVLDKDKTQYRRKMYDLISTKTGKVVNSIQSAYEIYDVLEFELLNGLTLPEWATRPQPSLQNKPLFPDKMRPLLVEWYYDTQWLRRNPDMLWFYSGPLFNSIDDQFKAKIKENEKNKERFRFHATHDDTIYTLLWALGFDNKNYEVEPGDGMAFELHKKKVGAVDEYFVQVVYYHSLYVEDSTFREVLELPNCPSPCPYDTFSGLYPTLTPEQFEQKCET